MVFNFLIGAAWNGHMLPCKKKKKNYKNAAQNGVVQAPLGPQWPAPRKAKTLTGSLPASYLSVASFTCSTKCRLLHQTKKPVTWETLHETDGIVVVRPCVIIEPRE